MAEERVNRKLAAILAADVVGYSIGHLPTFKSPIISVKEESREWRASTLVSRQKHRDSHAPDVADGMNMNCFR